MHLSRIIGITLLPLMLTYCTNKDERGISFRRVFDVGQARQCVDNNGIYRHTENKWKSI